MKSKEEQNQIREEINLLLTKVSDLKAQLPKNHNTSHLKNHKYSKEFFDFFKLKAVHDKNFTIREIEVCLFLSMGMTNQQIANQMFISEKAVKFHLSKIYRKLKIKSRLEAGIWLSEIKKENHVVA